MRTFLPERLGRDFRRLLTSSWVSNLGDGLALVLGALFVLDTAEVFVDNAA